MHQLKTIALATTSLCLGGCMATATQLAGLATTNTDASANTGSDKEAQAQTLPQIDGLSFDSPVAELAKEDISTSRTVGSVVGAMIAGYACYRKAQSLPAIGRGLAVAACGAVGSELGGALGEVVGEAIAIRRLKYASEYEFLESEIEATENALSTRQAQLDATRQELDELKIKVADLESRESLTAEEMATAKALKADLEVKIAENKMLEERYNDTLVYLNDTLAESESNIADLQEDKESTQAKLEDAKQKRDELLAQLSQVRLQSTELAATQTSLNTITSIG